MADVSDSTDSLIDALIVYSVTTGLLTRYAHSCSLCDLVLNYFRSVCALLDLIVHKIWDKTDVFFVFYFLLPKCMSFCLLLLSIYLTKIIQYT
jgi:hypothetical protein